MFTFSLNLGPGSASSLSTELLFIWCSTFSMQLLVTKTTNLESLSCTRFTLWFHDFISFKASFSSLSRLLIEVFLILLGLKSSFSILLINNSMLLFVLDLDLQSCWYGFTLGGGLQCRKLFSLIFGSLLLTWAWTCPCYLSKSARCPICWWIL